MSFSSTATSKFPTYTPKLTTYIITSITTDILTIPYLYRGDIVSALTTY